MPEDASGSTFIELTASIVSAYVSNNSVPSAELPALIGQVHSALARVSSGHGETPSEPPKPAISIKKSVTPDYIVCLEDGKKFKSLKRHLRTQYSMTPSSIAKSGDCRRIIRWLRPTMPPPARTLPSKWASVSSAAGANSSFHTGACGDDQRTARVAADALDHGTEPIRALRSEVLAQAEALEGGNRIGCQNVGGVFAGEHREKDRDQTAHDMGITVAAEAEDRAACAIGANAGRKPDLTRASLHLVRLAAVALG